MSVYVASWNDGAGKTALCAGIGKWLQGRGKKVGYLKPLLLTDTETSPGIDKDAHFLKQTLELGEAVETLRPLCLTPKALERELASGSLSGKVEQAYGGVAEGKDIVLLEGLAGLGDAEIAQACYQTVEALDASVIILIAYSTELPWERIASSLGERFGQRLLGIVINQAPQSKLESIRTEMISLFNREGIKVLGVLPEERLLLGVSVAELAERLEASILCCQEASSELVENVMIGALSVDSGVDYFKRKSGKAVIIRGERPDIQLAALATPTSCLILSGGVAPIAQVLCWAEDNEVPILQAKQDTLSTVAEVEEAISQARFQQQKKLEKMGQILQQHFDFEWLYQSLGLIG